MLRTSSSVKPKYSPKSGVKMEMMLRLLSPVKMDSLDIRRQPVMTANSRSVFVFNALSNRLRIKLTI